MTTPDATPDDPTARNAMTPREIVKALDRYIIGQHNAKRAVAIALRNRWRRQQIPAGLRDEISPKNIILIGPTGVGKTEVARRLARLARAPFVKVEASKFTEVGYVGRDVESMVRDLVDVAIALVRAEAEASIRERAQEAAYKRALDLLPSDVKFANIRAASPSTSGGPPAGYTARSGGVATRRLDKPRTDDLLERLKAGEFDDTEVEVEVPSGNNPLMQIFSQRGGLEEMDMSDLLGGAFPKNTSRKKLPLKEAMPLLVAQESDAMIDMDQVVQRALVRAQEDGIIFLDEIDKIAGGKNPNGPDVSRGGVQRDLLPIIEGSQVRTKHGIVKTDHILFIAAGAFHVAKPSDLLPELQGRFPIRVELDSLTEDDFARILTEPRNSLVDQYTAMLATEQLELHFTDDAVAELASIAAHVNRTLENIGARRLHTVMERLLDDLSFKAPELLDKRVTIDRAYVREALKDIAEDTDLSRYIL